MSDSQPGGGRQILDDQEQLGLPVARSDVEVRTADGAHTAIDAHHLGVHVRMDRAETAFPQRQGRPRRSTPTFPAYADSMANQGSPSATGRTTTGIRAPDTTC